SHWRDGMDSHTTRATLLLRVRDSADAAAWQEFDARYKDLILGYCFARGLQHADAQDVRQTVMLNLMNSLCKFEYDPTRGRFRDYLGRIVRNAVYRHFACPSPSPAALDTRVESMASVEDVGEADALWQQEWIDHHCRMAMQTIRKTFDTGSIAVFERLLAGEP